LVYQVHSNPYQALMNRYARHGSSCKLNRYSVNSSPGNVAVLDLRLEIISLYPCVPVIVSIILIKAADPHLHVLNCIWLLLFL